MTQSETTTARWAVTGACVAKLSSFLNNTANFKVTRLLIMTATSCIAGISTASPATEFWFRPSKLALGKGHLLFRHELQRAPLLAWTEYSSRQKMEMPCMRMRTAFCLQKTLKTYTR